MTRIESKLDYEAYRLGLRPPRVAVVFDASTEHWTYFARKAVWEASQTWGGSGFVYIPQVRGEVSSDILRAVVEYDPDFVVVSAPTVGEMLAADPAFATAHSEIAENQHEQQLLGALEPARQLVVSACTPYRRAEDWNADGVADWDELRATLPPSDSFGLLTPASLVGEPEYCHSTPAGLGGRLGWRAQLGLGCGSGRALAATLRSH